jgi:pyridoxine kinase
MFLGAVFDQLIWTISYVGNCVTTFVLQLLGLEVAALNTVQFSNHSGYRQTKGFRTTGEQITELYEGLKMNGNDDFGMLLSGYIPGAEGVEAVGRIARDLKEKRKGRKGGLFWGMLMILRLQVVRIGLTDELWVFLVSVLDPVMGDQGRLYVGEDVVPVYKSLLALADLIVPNQFEAE